MMASREIPPSNQTTAFQAPLGVARKVAAPSLIGPSPVYNQGSPQTPTFNQDGNINGAISIMGPEPSTTPCIAVLLRARTGNTSDILWSMKGGTGSGFALAKGAAVRIPVADAALVYFTIGTVGDGVDGWIEMIPQAPQ